MTEAMKNAIQETARRRGLQQAFNEKHGITPETIKKSIASSIDSEVEAHRKANEAVGKTDEEVYITEEYIMELEKEMLEAAESLDFERAANLRDQVSRLRDSIGKTLSESEVKNAASRKRKKQGGRRRAAKVPRPKRPS